MLDLVRPHPGPLERGPDGRRAERGSAESRQLAQKRADRRARGRKDDDLFHAGIVTAGLGPASRALRDVILSAAKDLSLECDGTRLRTGSARELSLTSRERFLVAPLLGMTVVWGLG